MSRKKLRIATRQSPLALWQANYARDLLLLKYPQLEIELLPMTTSGDKFLSDKLQKIGGKRLFVKELEEALLDGRADFAVHSMKNVPAKLPEGLSIPVVCSRASPFDALLSNHFTSIGDLPHGATVGTSSLRRQSQLLALRPDLIIKTLRGNIQTRVAKLHSGEYDAIVLAVAGLERMQLHHLIKEKISSDLMLPARGQGALGIECRDNDSVYHDYLMSLHDTNTALCVSSERHVNALLGGHCHAPVAVYCYFITDGSIILHGKVSAPDGSRYIENKQSGLVTQALQLAEQCASRLLSQGAEKLIAAGLT